MLQRLLGNLLKGLLGEPIKRLKQHRPVVPEAAFRARPSKPSSSFSSIYDESINH